MPEVDLFLLSHNNVGLLNRCLESIYRWTQIPFNLIILDDSTDLTVDFIELFMKAHDNCRVLRPKENVYCANELWQLGIENTESPFIVLMTNSCEVEPNWLDHMLNLMKQRKDIGIVGPKLVYPHSGVIESSGNYINEEGLPSHLANGQPGHRFSHLGNVQAVMFACALIRREAIEDEFKQRIYKGWRGFEDTEVCMSFRQRGWNVYYCGMSAVYHTEGGTNYPETRKADFWEDFRENGRIFKERWNGKAVAKVLVKGG